MKKGRCNRRYQMDMLKVAVNRFFDHPDLGGIDEIEERTRILLNEDMQRAIEEAAPWSHEQWAQTYEAIFSQSMSLLCEMDYIGIESTKTGICLCPEDAELCESLSEGYGEMLDVFEYCFDVAGLADLCQDLVAILTFVAKQHGNNARSALSGTAAVVDSSWQDDYSDNEYDSPAHYAHRKELRIMAERYKTFGPVASSSVESMLL